jgi:hypothetical protein
VIALYLPAAHPCASHAIGPGASRPQRDEAGAVAQGGKEAEVFAVALHRENNDMHADAIRHWESLQRFIANRSQWGAP